jgi:hypothetical protein
MVKTDNAATTRNYFMIQQYKSNGNGTASSAYRFSTDTQLLGPTSWTEMEYIFTTEPDAAKFRISMIYTDIGSTFNQVDPAICWYDNFPIQLTPTAADPNLIKNGSFTQLETNNLPKNWEVTASVPARSSRYRQ